MNINTAFPIFIEHLKGQSECNRRNYRQRLAGFLAIYGHCQPIDIEPADVNQWLASLNPQFSPATMAGYRQAIKAFFNWCERENLIDSSPASQVVVGKFSASRPKLPAESHVHHLANQAMIWLQSDYAFYVRDGLIFLLSLNSGPRISEIRNLRVSRVQLSLSCGPDTRQIYHAESTGKSGSVIIRYDQLAADGFNHWLALRPAAGHDYCFTSLRQPYNRLTRSGITKSYQRLAAAAGLEYSILSQALRHRAGHFTTRHYGPKTAAMLLNHADWQSASTATAFYYHPDEEDISIAAASLGVTDDWHELRRLFRVD